jgi:hypothetical protein
MPSAYGKDLNFIHAELSTACNALESPIMSLYDLGSRAFRDMKNVFRDQVTIVRLLRDLEMHLFRYMSGEDGFVPITSTVPTLSRSISQYDDVLLSKTVLEGDRIAADVEADLIDSLDSFHLGNKDFLAKHLGADECIIVWHLPFVHNQPVLALLIWREVVKCNITGTIKILILFPLCKLAYSFKMTAILIHSTGVHIAVIKRKKQMVFLKSNHEYLLSVSLETMTLLSSSQNLKQTPTLFDRALTRWFMLYMRARPLAGSTNRTKL